MDNADQVKKLLRQQAAVASFGSFALRQSDLEIVLTLQIDGSPVVNARPCGELASARETTLPTTPAFHP
jgi:hypothetical protein